MYIAIWIRKTSFEYKKIIQVKSWIERTYRTYETFTSIWNLRLNNTELAETQSMMVRNTHISWTVYRCNNVQKKRNGRVKCVLRQRRSFEAIFFFIFTWNDVIETLCYFNLGSWITYNALTYCLFGKCLIDNKKKRNVRFSLTRNYGKLVHNYFKGKYRLKLVKSLVIRYTNGSCVLGKRCTHSLQIEMNYWLLIQFSKGFSIIQFW